MANKDENGFEIVSGVDSETVVVTVNSEINFETRVEEAVRDYLTNTNKYTSVFNPDPSICSVTREEIARLSVDPQNSIEKTRKIAKIVDTYINKNYLLGMVDTAIRSNLNTKYKVSYSKMTSELGRNKATKLGKAKIIVDDFLDQINVKKLIRTSIPNTFNHGTYIFYLETADSNYAIHIFPLSVARIAPYRIGGEPVVMIDMDELKNKLEHNLPKRKGGKAYFFEKYENEIVAAYPESIVEAFRKKEKFAILDYRKCGVMRAGEDGDGTSLYGISQMLRAMSDVVVLEGFSDVDDAASKVKAKNILVQILRKELLGPTGERKTFNEAAFAHSELCRAVKNKICVYTGTAAVEDVKWVEPKSSLVDVNNVTLYENRVLSTLGVGFMAHGAGNTAVTSNISLTQLLRQINYISEQLEHILEKFTTVVLQEHGIEAEYAPKFYIVDSEQLEADLRIEFAKFLYGTLNCSRKTVFETINIDLADEAERRRSENEMGLDDIFKPYSIAYTNNNDTNNTGRPADKNSKDPDKQEDDKERNETK